MTELTETDATAVAWAIRILNEAGLEVSKANHAQRFQHGVEFKLQCRASTRANGKMDQLEGVKNAAMEAPTYGLDGEPIGGEEVDDAD